MIVYGARCTWWDDISKVGKLVGTGLPCCPHCKSVLFQLEDEKWFEGMKKYEAEGHPGYVAMIEWSRGKCFPSIEAIEAAWRASLT